MNSRPMSPMPSDPNDLNPLTPAHFMIGRSMVAAPDPDVLGIPEGRLSLFQRIQQLNQHFWKRWSREYITELQQRTKWRAQGRNLEKGAMVLVKEDNLPTSLWRIGRVVEVYPGPDGINRVAVIKTINGNIKRGFAKICPLPIYDNTTTSTDSEVI
ncbi:uncharacterized protein LOC116181801 [Photinus pyralis]|uniref:uncharacterized protein LOC116181801 n=1 Tax=Photinus pyralis TaxID=7054 RepID=UPI001266F474|nr:uncharacterized protein LOC116181801 [Photinus pyralis]